jgi:spermidine synthase
MNKKKFSSSYSQNNFDIVFKKICGAIKPESILEIGLLDGYSLKSFVDHSSEDTKIIGVDLFEGYEYKNSNFEYIKTMFSSNKNVEIVHGDFYSFYKNSDNFDIIHIDISNDGDTYRFSVENYLPITNRVLILEGGSEERDSVHWMKKYQKPKITEFLNSFESDIQFQTIELFPSITIFNKTNQQIDFI